MAVVQQQARRLGEEIKWSTVATGLGVPIGRVPSPGDKEPSMGTCPKCKQTIRRNGNHIKLGQVWYHKSCPVKPAKAKTG